MNEQQPIFGQYWLFYQLKRPNQVILRNVGFNTASDLLSELELLPSQGDILESIIAEWNGAEYVLSSKDLLAQKL